MTEKADEVLSFTLPVLSPLSWRRRIFGGKWEIGDGAGNIQAPTLDNLGCPRHSFCTIQPVVWLPYPSEMSGESQDFLKAFYSQQWLEYHSCSKFQLEKMWPLKALD